jgi:long-chain fatty acid transport protein
MTDKLVRYLCLCSVALGPTSALFAHGFRLPDQDAKATARGEAFAATADNASAIYYNPAGIGMLPGHNVRLGAYTVGLNVSYDSPAGGSTDTVDELRPVPHLFYSYGFQDLPIAVGLGVYAPFGLGIEWPETTGFRSLAIESEMSYMTLNPVIAWRVLTNLSIAAGPTLNYSKLDLKRGVTPYVGNDYSTLDGDATAFGFNVGVLWQPHPKVSFGIAYRSKTKMDYDGQTETKFVVPPPGYPSYLRLDARAEVPFPQSVVGGVSFRPTPEWNIEFDVDWTDWNQVNTVEIRQAVPQSLALNWESSCYYELGITRYFASHWQVSAGYIYNENSIPDKTFNPWVPDQNRHFVCVGAGYQSEYFSLDVAYQFGYAPTRTVSGSAYSMTGQNADGDYGYTSHAFAITLGFKF